MTGNGIPSGVGRADVRAHALNIGLVGTLINTTSPYLDAPEGSGAEEMGEIATSEMLERVVNLGKDTAGGVIMALVSLLIATAPQADVQAWLDDQAEKIREALS